MRVFIPVFAFKPNSCKNISVSLDVGNSYKVISGTKRTDPGIWIMVDNGKTKYDVYISDEELELGLIEKIKGRSKK